MSSELKKKGTTFRFGSHLPVLIRAIEKSEGAVLELGTGFGSTPYLHWACYHKKRKLVSMESSFRYYSKMKKLSLPWHEFVFVKRWETVDLSGDWSVVFVDHSPDHKRGRRDSWMGTRMRSIKQVVDADYIVAHDSEDEDYSEASDLFKYSFEYSFPDEPHLPKTIVFSNKHILRGFMDDN